jgi:hypothetical protein
LSLFEDGLGTVRFKGTAGLIAFDGGGVNWIVLPEQFGQSTVAVTYTCKPLAVQ